MPICNDLSNEKCCVILSKHFQSSFQLSNVAVQRNCSSPTNCPRVLLLSFRFQFDSKNLFQSKSSLVSWTSARVAHNVCVSAVAGIGGLSNGAKRNAKADQLRPVPRHNVNKENESNEDTEPRHCRKLLLWLVPLSLIFFWLKVLYFCQL